MNRLRASSRCARPITVGTGRFPFENSDPVKDVAVSAEYAADIRRPVKWAKPDGGQTAWFKLPIAALYDEVARAARDPLLQHPTQRRPPYLGAVLS